MATTPPTRITSKSSSAEISTELSSRRTGMSFQRTRMSADRTLMSVMRTAISLIGLGFTVYQFFERLQPSGKLVSAGSHATRNFGVTLIWLGIGVLTMGIVYHARFMVGL